MNEWLFLKNDLYCPPHVHPSYCHPDWNSDGALSVGMKRKDLMESIEDSFQVKFY